MENSTTVRAETVEKAIKIGLTKLGLDRDQVTINIINEGKRGLFGFGKQDAIVEVRALAPILLDEVETSVNFETPQVEESTTRVSSPFEDESLESSPLVEENVEIIEQEKSDVLEVEVEKEVTVTGDLLSQHEQVARYLENVIMSYGAQTHIKVEMGPNQVVFNIETDKSGYIIGKHGKIINSLQVLAQVMVHQYDKRRQSVILNIGDYRERRAKILEQIAERTAKEVLKTKRPVVLDPLPSYERKQIHAYLAKIDHIETHSEGKEPNRYLVVEYQA